MRTIVRPRLLFVKRACHYVVVTENTSAPRPSDVIASRVRQLRDERGWSARRLAEECAKVGAPELTPSAIANIESGRRGDEGERRRQVTAEELIALAIALDVSPAHLLAPADEKAAVRLTDTIKPAGGWVDRFVSGESPLPHRFEESNPDHFFRAAREGKRRAIRAASHPAVLAIQGLENVVIDAVLGPQERVDPPILADLLRREAKRVSEYVELLAQDVERRAH